MAKPYIALDVSPTQRANLATLLEHLQTTADPDHFDMSSFLVASDDDDEQFEVEEAAKHTCGSVGCMIGNGPAAGVMPTPGDNNDWHEYARRKFGADFLPIREGKSTPLGRHLLWQWCFGPDWANRDNTLAGGVERLKIALDKGVPSNWHDQLWGETPLQYQAA